MHDELRDALRRVEPPHGFAERVIERAHRTALAAPKRPTAAKAGGRLPARLAIAATLMVAIGGGVWYRAEERRREGEEAKRQVLVSLGIAGSKLRAVQMKINHEQER